MGQAARRALAARNRSTLESAPFAAPSRVRSRVVSTTIESYLKIGPLFVPVASFEGVVRDNLYIEGAIDLYVNGEPVMTRVEWDLVDQLWGYLLNLCENVAKGEKGKTYFPDQPIELELSPHGRRVELRLRYPNVERRAFEEREVLFAEVARAGSSFFENMARLVPEHRNAWEHELARIERLRPR